MFFCQLGRPMVTKFQMGPKRHLAGQRTIAATPNLPAEKSRVLEIEGWQDGEGSKKKWECWGKE